MGEDALHMRRSRRALLMAWKNIEQRLRVVVARRNQAARTIVLFHHRPVEIEREDHAVRFRRCRIAEAHRAEHAQNHSSGRTESRSPQKCTCETTTGDDDGTSRKKLMRRTFTIIFRSKSAFTRPICSGCDMARTAFEFRQSKISIDVFLCLEQSNATILWEDTHMPPIRSSAVMH